MRKPSGAALHHSVLYDDLAKVRRLLERGAPANFQDDSKNTALHFAASRKNYELTDLLLQHGADPNIQDSGLKTPLRWAVGLSVGSGEDERLIDLLLAHGADSWIEDDWGGTAVSCAEAILPDLAKRLKKAGGKKKRAPKNPLFERLAKKLLKIGGEAVQKGPCDAELKKLLQRGRVFPAKALIIGRGRIGECHANVARKYDDDWQSRGGVIVTGYSCSDDAWGLHSWIWHNGRVVETTLKREGYFGYELTPKEAKGLVKFYYPY